MRPEAGRGRAPGRRAQSVRSRRVGRWSVLCAAHAHGPWTRTTARQPYSTAVTGRLRWCVALRACARTCVCACGSREIDNGEPNPGQSAKCADALGQSLRAGTRAVVRRAHARVICNLRRAAVPGTLPATASRQPRQPGRHGRGAPCAQRPTAQRHPWPSSTVPRSSGRAACAAVPTRCVVSQPRAAGAPVHACSAPAVTAPAHRRAAPILPAGSAGSASVSRVPGARLCCAARFSVSARVSARRTSAPGRSRQPPAGGSVVQA